MTAGRRLACWVLLAILAARVFEGSACAADAGGLILSRFIDQAKRAGLPTRFLASIPPAFLTVEFDDLHAFAAEYHPSEHRMVLNSALSFNAAGGLLKPLKQLAPRDVGTVYHEFFHAYLDFLLSSDPAAIDPPGARLVTVARDRQQCRYQQVTITPIIQRPARTEVRFLSDAEAWEALHETWAVFVGWAVWTTVELQRKDRAKGQGKAFQAAFDKRLIEAHRAGELKGYYEPEHEAERAIARKRYLARSHRISPPEIEGLLVEVLESRREDARRLASRLERDADLPGSLPCRDLDTLYQEIPAP